jgi:TolA-binding protein
MRQNLFAFVMFISMLPFSAAQGQPVIQSQEGIALQNEILALQQQVQQLQSSNGGGGGSSLGGSAPAPDASGTTTPDSSIVASLLTQVQQLQQQVQTLNGEVDTLTNQVNTQHAATEKEIGDLKFAMTNAAGAATPGATPPGATLPPGAPGKVPALPAAAAATPPGSFDPKAELHAAQEAIITGDYRAAEGHARAILDKAKTSPAGYQAQFILAQSLYGQGRPQDAAIAFDDTYNRNREGMYAPQALLGLANSLTSIHQEAAACDTLASLNSQFPTPPAGLGPRIEAASHRAHCS